MDTKGNQNIEEPKKSQNNLETIGDQTISETNQATLIKIPCPIKLIHLLLKQNTLQSIHRQIVQHIHQENITNTSISTIASLKVTKQKGSTH